MHKGDHGRFWFKIGSYSDIMILIDFNLRIPLATIEQVTDTEESPNYWVPNQESAMCKFVATVAEDQKDFNFDPHNFEDTKQAVTDAIQWCEDRVGPPVRIVSVLSFIGRILMFWKYKAIWNKGKICGVTLRRQPND